MPVKSIITLIVFISGILACGPEEPARQSRLDERLFESIRQGNLSLADSCLRAGARLEARGMEGATPLIAAANAGRTDIARLLLERGADVQARREGYYGSTALMEVAVDNDTAMARLLLEYGADVNRRDTFGDPAINWAAYYGHVSFTRFLLEQGAGWDVSGRHGTALDIASRQWNLPLLAFFIEQGAGQPLDEEAGRRLLRAVQEGDVEDARRWLYSGASAGQKDELGTPALLWAAARGDAEMAGLLLQYGAGPDEYNRAGQTALAAAARFGHEGTVRLLLEAGADTDAAGERYRLTPLMAAAMGGHPACGRLLLEAGADPDIQETIDGFTALMYAVAYRHPAMVELLISYGANPYIKSRDGTGLYELVSLSASPEISRMIEAYVLKKQ